MTKVEDYTGAVNINADITPVTRQKIESVTPEKWGEMDINMLYDQRIIMQERVVKSLQAGHAEIAKQVQQGLNSLDVLLQYKADQAEKNPNAKSGFIR